MERIDSAYVSRGYRGAILAGGVYDMLAGLGLFFVYPILYVVLSALDPNLCNLSSVPVAGEPPGLRMTAMTHMKVNGMFMFFVGLGYLFPFVNYEKYKFYIPIFGVGLRTWAGAYLVWAALGLGLGVAYIAFGAVDLLFAGLYVYFLWSYRKKKVSVRMH
ncbi:MAG: hypothetical protein JW885_14470 [Deltaproteobacteria bacterium]|nr:hypothetical protein [Candidatus Zymogenaceae bacterium]